jgi:hypothetical protein
LQIFKALVTTTKQSFLLTTPENRKQPPRDSNRVKKTKKQSRCKANGDIWVRNIELTQKYFLKIMRYIYRLNRHKKELYKHFLQQPFFVLFGFLYLCGAKVYLFINSGKEIGYFGLLFKTGG